ncbi:NYN domain-containing protein [Patescibacteria group bacterium]|nr:NYN domain-containing protein [Patescibacteria group bacterium]
MAKTILYIDGENLKNYIKTVLNKANIKEKNLNIENLDLSLLLENPLKKIKISEKKYYSAKLRFYKNTPKKSKELIHKQRIQKTNLERQGINYIIGGNVRPQNITINGKKKTIFKEKGVDVKIAVDLVTNTCDKIIKTAILCSSDSDLQPAVKEVVARGIEVIYLGFEINPNKGLIYTTNRTILIRNSEVLDAYKESVTRKKK